jgi:hypothetical protein
MNLSSTEAHEWSREMSIRDAGCDFFAIFAPI